MKGFQVWETVAVGVVNPRAVTKLTVASAPMVREWHDWPLSELGDKIRVHLRDGSFSVSVEHRGDVHEVGRFDGKRWSWCRAAAKDGKFQPWEELFQGLVRSDADALCICVFRHSQEYCGNQAVSDFHKVHDLPFWQDFFAEIEPLFPVASVLLE